MGATILVAAILPACLVRGMGAAISVGTTHRLSDCGSHRSPSIRRQVWDFNPRQQAPIHGGERLGTLRVAETSHEISASLCHRKDSKPRQVLQPLPEPITLTGTQAANSSSSESAEEARRNRRINDDVQELAVTDETLPVEKFDHLYLLNTVLRETLDAINRVSVTLDVETAHPRLEVSEDRKSVRRTGTRRDLPDTGKRFTIWLCVLGSAGFTSGRQYWEVEVTEIRFWCLGVAAESVKRKGRVRLSPETGFWVIGRVGDVLHRDCDMSRVLPSPKSRLAAGPIP
ncbi:butyrophilin subfamily 2 member A2-like [Hemitrygon akajei]|uniref:butyrophilin subfamily 2 member A2-like n=1 Tax=Hemitrygon akajei TaxID=2704970 RepID=UPI003BF97A69